MTKRSITILGVSAVVAVGLLATPLLFARGGFGAGCPLGIRGGFGHGHGGFGQMGRVFHELDLTAEQKEALHRIHDATREKNAQAKAALHDGFVDAAKILLADPQNVAGAQAVIATREAAIGQLKANTMSGIAEALAVLTPEQRAKLAAHLDEHAKQFAR